MVSEEESDFDASVHPHWGLFKHVAVKGYQAGSLISLVAAVPILGFTTGLSLNGILKWTAVGSFLGTGFSSTLGMFKINGLQLDQVEDRVYRLHFNEGQVRVDKFSFYGASIGAVAFGAKEVSSVLKTSKLDSNSMKSIGLAVLGGAALGTVTAVVSHIVTNKGNATPSAMKKEILE
mmetsp:Transcript_9098/g.16370  ORF Transcript_9098/g.16370 Transcript_9098/m.16370 type:complete len:177 (-) Transcript_9098:39-569(-)